MEYLNTRTAIIFRKHDLRLDKHVVNYILDLPRHDDVRMHVLFIITTPGFSFSTCSDYIV